MKLLIFLFFPFLALSQKKYKYLYREHLKSQESFFFIQTNDKVFDNGKSKFNVQVLDKNGNGVSFAEIKLKSNEIDTVIQSDIEGFASFYLPKGTYSIFIFELELTSIEVKEFVIEENNEIDFTAKLGKSNLLTIAIIRSKRKLTQLEIDKLVDDLSNGKENNELILDKTCYVMWEI